MEPIGHVLSNHIYLQLDDPVLQPGQSGSWDGGEVTATVIAAGLVLGEIVALGWVVHGQNVGEKAGLTGLAQFVDGDVTGDVGGEGESGELAMEVGFLIDENVGVGMGVPVGGEPGGDGEGVGMLGV